MRYENRGIWYTKYVLALVTSRLLYFYEKWLQMERETQRERETDRERERGREEKDKEEAEKQIIK